MQPKTWVAQMSTEYSDITTETDVYQQNIPDPQRLRTNTRKDIAFKSGRNLKNGLPGFIVICG